MQIAQDVWLSLASNVANDMSKLVFEMHLEWKIQCLWASTKERLQFCI